MSFGTVEGGPWGGQRRQPPYDSPLRADLDSPSERTPDDLGSLSWLRAAYRGGRLRPLDLVTEVLARIEARGDDHVWISVVSPEKLCARALQLQALRELHETIEPFPLFGVPFAVKDNIDVEGLPTTNGCRLFDRPAPAHAPVVQRLIDAGAIVVGKTNMDQFATGLNGTRSPYGAVESVFGNRLIAGGSSSGSAVAVAAGLVTFALGTDTAGSGRVPAAMNGIVGLKPTRGRLSTVGVVPACKSLDCVSIFTRSVNDATTLLHLAEGANADDPWSRTAPGPASVAKVPSSLRVGVAADAVLSFFGDEPARHRYEAGRDLVGRLTASVGSIDLAPLVEAGDLLYDGPWVAERLAVLEEVLRRDPDQILAITRRVLESGRGFSAVDTFRAQHRLQELRHNVERLWRDIDVVVLPTVGTTFSIDELLEAPLERNRILGRYTQFANLLDLAVVAVPNGMTVDGRPASLSFIGPAWSEATLLALAGAFAGEAKATVAAPAVTAEPVPQSIEDSDTLLLAVVGRHLVGESRNHELINRGARLVGPARTAPEYRLFELGHDESAFPGLVRDPASGCAIEVELWRLPTSQMGSFIAGIPAPLSIGWVRLAPGHEVLGFLCEGYATDAQGEITATGGWRAYRNQTP